MSAPETLSIPANGLSFSALAWGEADAPLALLLHGYPDTAWTWRHLGPALAASGWRAVAPFTRGYGPTDLAPDDRYYARDLAADALALHTALGGDERAVLIGHDWGAVSTYAVTAIEPGRFARYVTLAVPPTPIILKPLTRLRTLGVAARQLPMSWYFVFNQLPGSVAAQRRVIPRLWRSWSPGYDASEDLTHLFAALDSPARTRAALRYYRNNLQGGAIEGFTTHPGAPLLYLHGEQDGCMLPDLMGSFPDALPAGSRFVRMPGVGHFPQLEDPAATLALIEPWLAA